MCLEEDKDAIRGSGTHRLLFSGEICVFSQLEGELSSKGLFSPPELIVGKVGLGLSRTLHNNYNRVSLYKY